MTRSSAGVGQIGRCDWLALLATDPEYYGSPFTVAAALVSSGEHRDEHGYKSGLYGIGVAGLAQIVRRKPQRVRADLVRLVADGWLAVGRRGGGRGRATLYRPVQPGLLAVPDPAQSGYIETQFDRRTRSAETQFGPHTGATRTGYVAASEATGTRYNGQSDAERTEYHGALLTPGVREETRREETPLPPSGAEILTWRPGGRLLEAEAVLQQFLPAMQPQESGYRRRMLERIAGWLEQGWCGQEIVAFANTKLPPVITSQIGVVASRIDLAGTPPDRAAAAAGGRRASTTDERVAAGMAIAEKYRLLDAVELTS